MLAIPALLEGAYLTRSGAMLAILALASGLVQVDSVFGVGFFSGVILFTAPAWLVLVLDCLRSLPCGRKASNQPVI